jgi:hypothetical protein
VLIGFLILLVIVVFILLEDIYSVKEVRMAALVIVKIIERSSTIGALIGPALEGLVKTFIWF